MDDNDVCPLCCEELDLSDQQFYPCKCGYQVCMWCWHRIRESESGLCPACRTPYGDDPHEFSAVDVAEVLKANKEKAAAEKREKERLRAQQAADGEGLHSRSGSDGDGMSLIGLGRGPMDLPKDRNQLANMRVIRRNLVYAVGLPPTIASEDTLRKPDYFGQYGKISKIVLNRSNTTGGDPRRASASAYVTFVHKEDTLSCILALDGFYCDGRNIRASYGTSKYCSAFIKNVRCNNPECTYLHCMGDAEDTFTKQEIQAGYVTSGRDVLARQQQIVAQALSAASGNAANAGGARRKTGGGGPSGTGKAASNPQFPPPTFDEPLKSSSTSLVPPPPSAAPVARSSSGPVFSSVAAAGTASAAKLTRSNSGSGQPGTPVLGAVPAPKGSIGTIVGAPNSAFPTPAASSRKAMGATAPSSSTHAPAGASGATAASVVAGVHSSSTAAEPPASHQTLTPLTPLKRASSLSTKSSGAPGLPGIKSSGMAVDSGTSNVQLPPNMPVPKGLNPEQRAAFLEQRREAMAAMARQQTEMAMKLTSLRQGNQKSSVVSALNGQYGTAPTSPSSSISSAGDRATSHSLNQSNTASNEFGGVGSIGGTVIGGAPIGSVGSIGGGVLGGPPIGGSSGTKGLTSSLGGEIYTGPPASSNAGSVIGGGNDKWNSEPNRDSLFSGSNEGFALNSGGIWDGSEGQNRSPGVIGGGSSKAVGTIGGSSGGVIGGTSFGSSTGGYNSGSSALASMLGISLPTGSGSLRESTTLWDSSTPAPAPIAAGVIGAGAGPKPNSAPIGGFAIGGGTVSATGGSFQSNSISPNPVGNNNNNRDIALLQTLLPGVHITSSNNQQPPAQPSSNGGFGAVGGGGWNASGPPVSQSGIGGLNGNPQNQSGGTWGDPGVQPAPVGARGGILGQNNSQQNQKQGQSSIW